MCADVFRYYDGGPRKGEVLLCLPGASGTAEIFYKQMLILCPKGYRVVTVQFPPYYAHDDWLAGESTLVPSCPHLRLRLRAFSLHVVCAYALPSTSPSDL